MTAAGKSGAAAGPRLLERVDKAFADYAQRVEEVARAGKEEAGSSIRDAYEAYADAVRQMFAPPDLATRAWEFYATYVRALQGVGRFEDAVSPYTQLLQASADVGQRVLERYQTLVTSIVTRVDRTHREGLDAAYASYAADLQRAWKQESPQHLSAGVILAASQSMLAASSVHGVVLEAIDATRPRPA